MSLNELSLPELELELLLDPPTPKFPYELLEDLEEELLDEELFDEDELGRLLEDKLLDDELLELLDDGAGLRAGTPPPPPATALPAHPPVVLTASSS
jgi:hypothetical protein